MIEGQREMLSCALTQQDDESRGREGEGERGGACGKTASSVSPSVAVALRRLKSAWWMPRGPITWTEWCGCPRLGGFATSCPQGAN